MPVAENILKSNLLEFIPAKITKKKQSGYVLWDASKKHASSTNRDNVSFFYLETTSYH